MLQTSQSQYARLRPLTGDSKRSSDYLTLDGRDEDRGYVRTGNVQEAQQFCMMGQGPWLEDLTQVA